MKRMSVAVLWALAEPDDQALAGALEVAGKRHMIEYRLVSRSRKHRRKSL
jgi:hypothetical protein